MIVLILSMKLVARSKKLEARSKIIVNENKFPLTSHFHHLTPAPKANMVINNANVNMRQMKM